MNSIAVALAKLIVALPTVDGPAAVQIAPPTQKP
jgi:hypothetical protein